MFFVLLFIIDTGVFCFTRNCRLYITTTETPRLYEFLVLWGAHNSQASNTT